MLLSEQNLTINCASTHLYSPHSWHSGSLKRVAEGNNQIAWRLIHKAKVTTMRGKVFSVGREKHLKSTRHHYRIKYAPFDDAINIKTVSFLDFVLIATPLQHCNINFIGFAPANFCGVKMPTYKVSGESMPSNDECTHYGAIKAFEKEVLTNNDVSFEQGNLGLKKRNIYNSYAQSHITLVDGDLRASFFHNETNAGEAVPTLPRTILTTRSKRSHIFSKIAWRPATKLLPNQAVRQLEILSSKMAFAYDEWETLEAKVKKTLEGLPETDPKVIEWREVEQKELPRIEQIVLEHNKVAERMTELDLQAKAMLEGGHGAWRVESKKPLSEPQLRSMFENIRGSKQIVYRPHPRYFSARQPFTPFVIDRGEYKDLETGDVWSDPMIPASAATKVVMTGRPTVCYAHAFENAASSMETLIMGGRNCANMALDMMKNHVPSSESERGWREGVTQRFDQKNGGLPSGQITLAEAKAFAKQVQAKIDDESGATATREARAQVNQQEIAEETERIAADLGPSKAALAEAKRAAARKKTTDAVEKAAAAAEAEAAAAAAAAAASKEEL
jgi:hypothetical protein